MSKILTQSQAKAVYSAMCVLNNVSGGLHATLEQDGAVHVAEVAHGIEVWIAGGGAVENYADQSAFAAAYGLGPETDAPLTTNEAILEAVATANAHLNNACVPTFRDLEQAVTAGAPQVLDFLPNGQRQDDYAMGWRDAMDRVYGRMQAAILAQRAINNAERCDG